MKAYIRQVLLVGVAATLAVGAAQAQMVPPPPAPDMYGPGPMHGRLADRLMRDFDINKDGKITKAEVEKALAQRFAAVSGGSGTISEAQFANSHETMLRDHSTKMFRRIDWNGDGVLSLDEFRAPLRARFERRDRDASGTIVCKSGEDRPVRRVGKGSGMVKARMHRHGHRHFGGAMARMCSQADLNKDGKVSRAEFDKAVAGKYSEAIKGAQGMTPVAFYNVELVRFREKEARRFKRLDKNHDGKLGEAEFAAPGTRLFARLDRNGDGVLTPDELSQSHRGRHHGSHRGWHRKPG